MSSNFISAWIFLISELLRSDIFLDCLHAAFEIDIAGDCVTHNDATDSCRDVIIYIYLLQLFVAWTATGAPDITTFRAHTQLFRVPRSLKQQNRSEVFQLTGFFVAYLIQWRSSWSSARRVRRCIVLIVADECSRRLCPLTHTL